MEYWKNGRMELWKDAFKSTINCSLFQYSRIPIFQKKSRHMSIIELENMEFYSYHGCFKEEQVVGNHFTIDLSIETDTSKAQLSDSLHDTVNYQQVYGIVKSEMEKKSKLLEHVADRILSSLFNEFNAINKATVKVSKVNPPMGGKIQKVSVKLSRER